MVYHDHTTCRDGGLGVKQTSLFLTTMNNSTVNAECSDALRVLNYTGS